MSEVPSGDRTIAVTGSSGFVGRHLLAHWARQGTPTVSISRRGGSEPSGPRHVTVADYREVGALRAALRGVATVVHLAARAHQESSSDDAASFHAANVESTLALARAAIDSGVRRIVLISSIGVHGERTLPGLPFTERDPLSPTAPYAVSKAEAERQLEAFTAGRDIDYVTLRPPLVYGPDAPGNFARLLRLVERLPLVPLAGLRKPRSMIFVDNLCDAIDRACVHPQARGRAFVLSDGMDLSVADIARELSIGLGRDPRRVIDMPEKALRWAAAVVGREATLSKLADELTVDASDFRASTGWTAPWDAREALRATATDHRNAARHGLAPRP